MDETILTNGRIVCRDGIVEGGTVVLRHGRIAELDEGRSGAASALDLDGDYLLPGLVELHTDNLEKHFLPRPGVLWPSSLAAVLSHDQQMACAGITTVFDAISLGVYEGKEERRAILGETVAALARAGAEGLTRAEHFLHLRCEISDPAMLDMFEPYAGHPLVRLASVMDHTPGQRQWWDIGKYIEYYKLESLPDAALEERLARLRAAQAAHAGPSRRAVVEACRARGVALASHDDATPEHIDEAVEAGIAISEFPLTLEVAGLARRHGLKTIMGAPNVVRGRSHSGNMSAIDCAEAGLLDGLSSDYVPGSLLMAVFILAQKLDLALPDAVALASDNLAAMVGLDDRGRIEAGRRADLLRVKAVAGAAGEICPVVRQVWRQGVRIA